VGRTGIFVVKATGNQKNALTSLRGKGRHQSRRTSDGRIRGRDKKKKDEESMQVSQQNRPYHFDTWRSLGGSHKDDRVNVVRSRGERQSINWERKRGKNLHPIVRSFLRRTGHSRELGRFLSLKESLQANRDKGESVGGEGGKLFVAHYT